MSILGIILVAVGSLLILRNWIISLECWWKKKGSSTICPFPSVLVFGGSLMLPSLKPYGWLAFIIDYSVPCFVIALPWIIYTFWFTSRWTRIREMWAFDPPRLFVLTLHRRGYFYIKLTCDPPQIENDHGAILESLGITGRWETSDDGFLLTHYFPDQRTLQLRQSGTNYVATENNYPQDERYSLDSMNGLTFSVVR